MFDLLPEDFEKLNINRLLNGCKSAEVSDLKKIFDLKAKQAPTSSDEPIVRIASSLSAICGMHFQPYDHTEPFRSMAIFENRRSPNLEDFYPEQAEELEHAISSIDHPILRARIADVCFTLSTKNRYPLAKLAVLAYVDAIQKVRDQKFHFSSFDKSFCGHNVREMLMRALNISASTKHQKPLFEPLRLMSQELLNSSIEQGMNHSVKAFAEMALEHRTVSPQSIGDIVESFAKSVDAAMHRMDLYQVAEQAYKSAKNDDGHLRCNLLAAEACREYALSMKFPPIQAHWLSTAVQILKDNPSTKARQKELHAELLSVQSEIPTCITPITSKTDISDLQKLLDGILDELSFVQRLKFLAESAAPPSAETLKEDAISSFSQFLLSNFFGSAQIDRHGKTTRSTPSYDFDKNNDEAIFEKIHQDEEMRRQFICATKIRRVMHAIQNEDHIDPKVIGTICTYSPFIPEENRRAFFLGFMEFLKGQNATATTMLVPLFENVLRNILREQGHITSIFDGNSGLQSDMMLGPLMTKYAEELKAIFGEDGFLQIELLFGNAGANIRNRVAHGIYSDSDMISSDAIYANCFIFLVCSAPLFPKWESYFSSE
ncbi:MAG: DUF4209 domain-containing protein [Cohaesibacter sp.]|nr:DUF4209 domain-containing protein [Cohaesibacter sp.]